MTPGREIYVGVGSNVDAQTNVRKAIIMLRQRFGRVTVSPAYQTRAVGFEGDDFINLVVSFGSERAAGDIREQLSDIEMACGRTRETPRFGPRTLDLDLLLFGEEVLTCNGVEIPRPEILQYAFVLKPLSDIAADSNHPAYGETFAALWRKFADKDQAVIRLDLKFG